MILCMYPWPLRSHLALPDGTGFYVRRDGRDVLIRCTTADGASLYSYTGQDYGWLPAASETREGYVAELSASGSASPELTPYRYIYYRARDPWVDGIVDPTRYTRLEVSFELESTDVLDDDLRFDEISSWVETVVRYFVDMYRLVTQEIDVQRPRADDVAQTNVSVADAGEYTFNRVGSQARFRLYRPILRWTPAPVAGHNKRVRSDEDIAVLSDLLRHGGEIPLSSQLLLDAKEQSHKNGQHDLCVVLAATAFEAYLREALLAACEGRNIQTLSARAGDASHASVDYKRAIAQGDTRRDLLRYVEELSGQTVRGGREHNAWYNDAHEVRNRLVHRGERGVDQDGARKAFDAVAAYIGLIDGKLR